MTLIEHIRELRSRLTKAVLAILGGFFVAFYFADQIFNFIKEPYCNLNLAGNGTCDFLVLKATDPLLMSMKIALWGGLIVAAPFWLYQLWAFIAPGLHKHERKWAYMFGAIAVPLFFGGAVLASLVVSKGLDFLLNHGAVQAKSLEASSYLSFVTNLVLLFGLSFEFPVLLLLLNFTGMVRGKRMLGWWRVAIIVFFAFAAITTPDPGPFGMTLLACALMVLYFIACGIAILNDKRRDRKHRREFPDLGDDQASQLEYDPEPIEGAEPVATPSVIDEPTPVEQPERIERQPNRWDDMT
ncbi:twin-arginine translocase subunit TatC [Hamadaea sp. NPDC051192]|uniref:twin-arginine translocase subunit TatC n=1 Tax=Hamadaea sp. NPDC051192 TaxID=3154940 RepID=UPI0034168F12